MVAADDFYRILKLVLMAEEISKRNFQIDNGRFAGDKRLSISLRKTPSIVSGTAHVVFRKIRT
jgi:hypothetical protein